MQNELNMKMPWEKKQFERKWEKKSGQTINSSQYKELKKYIHMPYRKTDGFNTRCYYFPTYVVFKIKNITEFNFDSLSARINGVLIIKINVDYHDNFNSEETDITDQVEIRQALQSIFNFHFDKNKQKTKIQNKISEGSKIIGQNYSQNFNSKYENREKDTKKYLYVQFNRDNPLRLPSKRVFEGQIKQEFKSEEQGCFLMWTVRKQFTISLAPGTLFEDLIAPFNLLNFKLSMTFQDMDVIIGAGEKKQAVKFKFNCMKRVGDNSVQQQRRIFEQLSFTDDGSLGQYDLAETSLQVACEKARREGEEQQFSDEKYSSFKIVTFTIPFYKYPIMDALTIFIPLVLITILTLFTFVQGPDYNDKIGNIATLMIVYVGLVPVISDSLPPTTSITLIDIVVYSQLFLNVLCLIRGYIIKDSTVSQFNQYQIWNDPLFIISVCISAMSGVILFILLIYYCVKKSCYYNLQESDIDQGQKKINYWVSPHMYKEARDIKTEILKIKKEKAKKLKNMNQNKQINVQKNGKHKYN